MQIVFLSTRQSKPSFRFRVEQMLPEFTRRGHQTRIEFLSSNSFARMRLYRELRGCDAVFLQKRLLSTAERWLLRSATRCLIYDLDDAVMFNGDGVARGRSARRFNAICKTADLVVAGNNYLADFARPHTAHVTVIPTCIDTEAFHPKLRPSERADASHSTETSSVPQSLLTVGWTGSRSTNRYLNDLFPVLSQFGGRIRVKVVSDTLDGLQSALLGDVPLTFIPWSPEVEITEPATFDVGLMPLPDDPWTRGKCGFKALQYMGLGVTAVASAVGVNREILTHHEDGLLIENFSDWHPALSRLIADADLRNRLGTAGRERVVAAYSLHTQAPRLVDAVETALARSQRNSRVAG